jgi:hypothetical protein
MAFHYANAWESDDGRTITLIVPTFKDPEMVNGMLLERLRADDLPVEAGHLQYAFAFSC